MANLLAKDKSYLLQLFDPKSNQWRNATLCNHHVDRLRERKRVVFVGITFPVSYCHYCKAKAKRQVAKLRILPVTMIPEVTRARQARSAT